MDSLIPIGALLFIVLLAVAIVVTARKQRRQFTEHFAGFASGKGYRFSPTDPGVARSLASGLDGIGQFSSPSLGELTPQNVVEGDKGGRKVVLFSHQTRFSEGDSRQWIVCIVETEQGVCPEASIQFLRGKSQLSTSYLRNEVVQTADCPPFQIALRGKSKDEVAPLTEQATLQELASLAASLPFRPEVQVRRDRVAAYPAERNFDLSSVDELEKLEAFTSRVADVIGR